MTTTERRIGVILLSGGLDSTTVAALARREGHQLAALTVQYGQTHLREIDAARQVAARLGLRHQVVDAPFFKQLAFYSALTQPEAYALPAGRPTDAMAQDIPISYVPLRNTFLLTMAAAWLESWALAEIEERGVEPAALRATIFIAANAIDYSGYPDCRPEFYHAATETFRLGSKLGAHYGRPIEIATPIIQLTKAEIARLAMEVGAPVELTWSCYRGGDVPCGSCDSCLLRAKGFADAGLDDPALRSTTRGEYA